MSTFNPADSLKMFGDLGKMMEQFKVPGVDMNAIIESRRKDMDALVAANQEIMGAMQQIAQKQAEILTQAMLAAQAGVQNLDKGMADPTRQAEVARKAYETAVHDMKELADIARKAQADALAGITERAQQSVQEIQKFMQAK